MKLSKSRNPLKTAIFQLSDIRQMLIFKNFSKRDYNFATWKWSTVINPIGTTDFSQKFQKITLLIEHES